MFSFQNRSKPLGVIPVYTLSPTFTVTPTVLHLPEQKHPVKTISSSRRLSSAEDRHRGFAVAVIAVTDKARDVLRQALVKGSFTDYYTTVRQNVNF